MLSLFTQLESQAIVASSPASSFIRQTMTGLMVSYIDKARNLNTLIFTNEKSGLWAQNLNN